MSTYLKRYELINVNADQHGALTLYEATKTLSRLAAEGKAHDSSHIRCDGRVVAFYSNWIASVRATDLIEGRGATAEERELVNGWAM